MEFKALFYIIAIILWLIFKFFENQKGLLKKIVQKMEPPIPVQNLGNTKPVVLKSVKVPIVKNTFKNDLVIKTGTSNEKIPSGTPSRITTNEEVILPLETASIINEIRDGNVDWRKAILLAEILRPV